MIAVTMGSKGQIGRLLAPKHGAFLTFGSLGSEKESATGQPTVTQLANVYKIQRLRPSTQILGLISNPVSHSKGFLLHNALMAEAGFDGMYVPCLVDDVRAFLTTYSSHEYSGFRYECANGVSP